MKWFENISVNPKDVTDLKELIPLSIDQDEDFQKYTSLKKVKNGDPVAFLGEGDDVGVAGSGCDPVYEEYGVANSQKRWELGDWQIPLKICYESLQGYYCRVLPKDWYRNRRPYGHRVLNLCAASST